MEQKDICDNKLASLIAGLPNRTADMPDAYPRDWPQWTPYEDCMGGGQGWTENLWYETWEEFQRAHGFGPAEWNVVIDFYFDVEPCDDESDCVADIPGAEHETLHLYLWMTHPRKGASRAITINSIAEEELPEIREYLARSAKIMEQRFAWAVDGVFKVQT